jgi:predicted permease
MGTLLQDLRYAIRVLLRSPGFGLIAVVVVSVGIGATTAIFSAVNALLLRPLPLPEPHRLVDVVETTGAGGHSLFTYEAFLELRDGLEAVDLTAWSYDRFNLRKEGGVESVSGVVASGNYFELLGARAARGRFFDSMDDRRGDPHAVTVLSDAGWRRHFGADESVIGQAVYFNGQPVTVIGIAPQPFTGTTVGVSPDMWVPMTLAPRLKGMPSLLEDRQIRYYNLVGRLAPGVTHQQAAERLTGRAQQMAARGNTDPQARIQLHPTTGLPVDGRGAVWKFMGLLLGTAMLVLCIASVNVAGMLLARAATRRREMAIRLAVGAGRGRLVRQLLTECAVIFLLGGAAGILLSRWIVDLLLVVPMPISGSVALNLGVDLRVLAFALGLSLATGIACGLVPALQASRTDPVSDLKAAGQDRRRVRMRSAFVIAQLAMTLLLLVGAGLFVRALQRAGSLDPGFEVQGMVIATFDFRLNGYDARRGRELVEALRQQIEALPGVESTGLSHAVPLGRMNWAFAPLEVPGHPDTPPGKGLRTHMNWVDPGYFRTMRIPILRGRAFSGADDADAPKVAIVSQALVRRFWPEGDPIGARIRLGDDLLSIVGVARDVQDRELGQQPGLYVYRPLEQSPSDVLALAARTHRSESALVAAILTATRALDANAPLMNAVIFREWLAVSFLPQRVAAILTGIFGIVALLLAAVGLYGVVSYSVAQRTREIGIRMALGARSTEVVRLVFRQALVLVCIGTATGALAALALTRVLSGMLFGVSATDPAVFIGVVCVLASAALVASYIPASRATRVDPTIALRAE